MNRPTTALVTPLSTAWKPRSVAAVRAASDAPPLRAPATFLWVLLACCPLAAQTREVAWRVPDAELRIDYRNPPASLQPVFLDDGFGVGLPFQLALVGRDRVRVTARLPDAGRLTIHNEAPGSRVEAVALPASGAEAGVELRVTLPLLTPEQASLRAAEEALAELAAFRKPATQDAHRHAGSRIREALRRFDQKVPEDEDQQREAYIPLRMCELGKDQLLAGMKKFADQHPTWIDRKQAQEWPRLPGPTLVKFYQHLKMLDIAAEHLAEWGFELDTTRVGADRLIGSKFLGLHALVSGQSLQDAGVQSDIKSLAVEEQQRVRQALTVSGKLVFYPRVEAKDANSQWFNGQKIQAAARGVSVIRVQGTLHSAEGDPADWWTLRAFDGDSVRLHLPRQDAWKGTSYESANGLHLRIHSLRDGPVPYTFELIPRSVPRAGREIHIYESPSLVPGGFPY